MPALEPVSGLRVVAEPASLDGARWAGDGVTVLRFAPDEAFAIGAVACETDDPDAIVVEERGFVGARCSAADLAGHIEWTVPAAGPAFAQGAVAGVPVKVRVDGDPDRILLVTAAAYADELAARLGWGP